METKTLEDAIAGFSKRALGLEESEKTTTTTTSTTFSSSSPETPRVLLVIASLLEKLIRRNEKLLRVSRKDDVVSIFHGSKAPNLSVRQYIERIFMYSNCSTSCFVVAYIYIDRFLQKRSGFYLTSLNAHRLLITSVMLAAKFLEDECDNNAYYAKVGGVSTAEINELEMDFLFSLEFRLHVTTEVFDRYCQYLERESGSGSGRGVGGKYQIDRQSTHGRQTGSGNGRGVGEKYQIDRQSSDGRQSSGNGRGIDEKYQIDRLSSDGRQSGSGNGRGVGEKYQIDCENSDGRQSGSGSGRGRGIGEKSQIDRQSSDGRRSKVEIHRASKYESRSCRAM